MTKRFSTPEQSAPPQGGIGEQVVIPPSLVKMHSIKFEISVLFTLILAVILVIFTGVLYSILAHTLNTDLDYELKLKAQEVSQSIRTYLEYRGAGGNTLMFALEKTIASDDKQQGRWWFTGFERRWFKRLDKLDLAGGYINFATREGAVLKTSPNLSPELLGLFLQNLIPGQDGGVSYRTLKLKEAKVRLINYPFEYQGSYPYILQVGMSPNPIALMLQDWLQSITLSIPFILVLAFFVGRILAARILAPVQALTRAAQKFSHEDLSARVPAEGTHVELQSLANAFNEMISRLERSFLHIQEFSAHVAHELKTPIAIIQGETELALRKPRQPEDYQKALKVTGDEAQRMLRTIEDLLLLTTLDYDPELFHFEEIEFSEFFAEIYEQTKILVEQKDIAVHLRLPDETVKIKADQLHLRRLFFNLISNALKITPAKKHIYLLVEKEEKEVCVSIIDAGPGIAKEDLQKIFEPFFRGDRNRPGTGLGLSIARTIAQMHNGRIEVQSKLQEGSTFKVYLPLAGKMAQEHS